MFLLHILDDVAFLDWEVAGQSCELMDIAAHWHTDVKGQFPGKPILYHIIFILCANLDMKITFDYIVCQKYYLLAIVHCGTVMYLGIVRSVGWCLLGACPAHKMKFTPFPRP